MTTAPLPPFPKPDIWSHVVTVWRDGVECQIDQGPRFTSDQMQAYATQARADLEVENKRLRGVLASVHQWMDDQADAQSKGGHATFDLMMLREQRDIARAALEKQHD